MPSDSGIGFVILGLTTGQYEGKVGGERGLVVRDILRMMGWQSHFTGKHVAPGVKTLLWFSRSD